MLIPALIALACFLAALPFVDRWMWISITLAASGSAMVLAGVVRAVS